VWLTALVVLHHAAVTYSHIPLWYYYEAPHDDSATVLDVFLALDHSFGPDAVPILFETMVFINESGGDMERYATWDEAEAGHARWVAKVFKPTPILTLPEKA